MEVPSSQTDTPQHISTRCQLLVSAHYDVIKLYAGSMSKQIFTLLGATVTAEVKNLGPNRPVPEISWREQMKAKQILADVLSANIQRSADQEIAKH